MNAQEKVAYLKGLMDGMKLDKDDNSTKLFAAVSDVLEELAKDVDDLDTGLCELNDEVDEIDEDLGSVEELVYGVDDDDDDDEDEEESCCYSAKCPNCGETVEFDECDIEDGVIFCPNCNEKLEFTCDDDDECDDSCCEEGCCCDHEEEK